MLIYHFRSSIKYNNSFSFFKLVSEPQRGLHDFFFLRLLYFPFFPATFLSLALFRPLFFFFNFSIHQELIFSETSNTPEIRQNEFRTRHHAPPIATAPTIHVLVKFQEEDDQNDRSFYCPSP